MSTYIMLLNYPDQGIRNVKDCTNRHHAAKPMDQPHQLAKMMVKTMPVTYTGADVEAIEPTDKLRSSSEPSRLPAIMPTPSPIATLTLLPPHLRPPARPTPSRPTPPPARRP